MMPFKHQQIGERDVMRLLERHLPMGAAKVRDMSLFQRALVHRSYAASNGAKRDTINSRCPEGAVPIQSASYERLEYLGDAVLGLVTAAYLYERYPDEDEGFLTQMRTQLINGRMLAALCRQTSLPQFVLVSQPCDGATASPSIGTGASRSILEDVFEAFLGALFIDSGYDTTRDWLIAFLENSVDFAALAATRESAKAVLNRHCKRTLGYVPTTERLDDGVVRLVTPTGAVISTGRGVDGREAEAAAVRGALAYYGIPHQMLADPLHHAFSHICATTKNTKQAS